MASTITQRCVYLFDQCLHEELIDELHRHLYVKATAKKPQPLTQCECKVQGGKWGGGGVQYIDQGGACSSRNLEFGGYFKECMVGYSRSTLISMIMVSTIYYMRNRSISI